MTTQQLRWYGVPECEAQEITCKRCAGTGVSIADSTFTDEVLHSEECPDCGGLAKYHKETP